MGRKKKGGRGKQAKGKRAKPAAGAEVADSVLKISWWRQRWILPVAVGLLSFALYANTLGHLYSIDDNLVIYGNRYVKEGVTGLPQIFSTPYTYGVSKFNDNGYRPLPIAVYALEHQLFGAKAFLRQHLVHVLLFSLSMALLFLLLRRLLRDRGVAPALVATLLYAAHPVHTEVVANLKSLDEILVSLCGLMLTLLALLQFIDSGKRRFWVLACAAYATGLLCKETSVTYLAVIPLTLYVFTDRPLKKIALLCLPLVLLAAGYLLVRHSVLSRFPTEPYDFLQNPLFGATEWDHRHATAMLVMLKYLGLLLFPHPLVWDYSYNQIPLARLWDLRVLLSVLLHLGLLIFALRGLRRRRNVLAWCVLFYMTTLAINSNLFVVGPSIMGERSLYTPSLGFCVAAALGLGWIARRLTGQGEQQSRWLLALITVAVLLPLGYKTVNRNRDWKDSLTISLADVESSPNSIRVHSTLGAVYLAMAKQEDAPAVKRGLYTRVIPVARRILEIYPAHKEARYNIGISHFYLKQFDKAEAAFRRHLTDHPTDYRTYNNIGGLYYFRRDYRTALSWFERFVAKNPRDARAVNNLGTIRLDNLKDPQNAIPHFRRAAALDPTFAEPHRRLGDAHSMLRQLPLAIAAYRKALKLDPRLRGGPVSKRLARLLVFSAMQRGKGFRRPPVPPGMGSDARSSPPMPEQLQHRPRLR